ncbi:MAG: hypothetical protein RDU25_00085 [Patescibacteria group bacterium]|nr:hypothetical protein [Patescibacteria group bacterium]
MTLGGAFPSSGQLVADFTDPDLSDLELTDIPPPPTISHASTSSAPQTPSFSAWAPSALGLPPPSGIEAPVHISVGYWQGRVLVGVSGDADFPKASALLVFEVGDGGPGRSGKAKLKPLRQLYSGHFVQIFPAAALLELGTQAELAGARLLIALAAGTRTIQRYSQLRAS